MDRDNRAAEADETTEERPTPEPTPAEPVQGSGHPLTPVLKKVREASAELMLPGTENEMTRVARVLGTLACAADEAGEYVTKRGSGYADQPLEDESEYDEAQVKSLRFDLEQALESARKATQTNAVLIAGSRARAASSISPEFEMLLRQLISALISRLFAGLKFTDQPEAPLATTSIVTGPQPRTHPARR